MAASGPTQPVLLHLATAGAALTACQSFVVHELSLMTYRVLTPPLRGLPAVSGGYPG